MLISEVVKQRQIKTDLVSTTKEALFDEMLDFLAFRVDIPDLEEVKKTLWQREKMLTTGILPYIALPHTQVKNLERTVGMIGLSKKGIDYGALDNQPVNLVMFFIDNEADTLTHLQIIRNAAMLASNPRFLPQILTAKTPEEAYQIIRHFETLDEI